MNDSLKSLAEHFDSAWQDQPVSIEKYLELHPTELPRDQVLLVLIPIEARLRRDTGDTSGGLDDYVARFGELEVSEIQTALRAQLDGSTMDTSDTGNPRKSDHSTVSDPTLDLSASGVPEIGKLVVDEFGDYKIEEEIARGGMGVVYRAHQKSLDRTVAIKMILSGELADASEVQRFRTEAEAAAKLDHPGIVPIYEIGEHENRPYFSMAFVDGPSLKDWTNGHPLPARQSAELTKKIAAAVAAAHKHGVIHRDLKPANVLLNHEGEPRITDFGLAKRLKADSQLTHTGQIIGTPSYMAPEQAAGEQSLVSERADVYAIGGLLYFMLTGRPPFQASTSLKTLQQVVEQELVPPSRFDNSIPSELEAICIKCLTKDLTKRYASADEVVNELSEFLSGLSSVSHLSSPSNTKLESGASSPQKAIMPWILSGIAIAVLLVIGLVGLQSFSRDDSENVANGERDRESDELAGGNANPTSDELVASIQIERFEIRAARERGAFVPIQNMQQLRPDDAVQFEVELSEPAYVKLLWIDAKGEVAELYPDDPELGTRNEGTTTNFISPYALDRGWPLEPVGDSEMALLLVRHEPFDEEPLPTLQLGTEDDDIGKSVVRFRVSGNAPLKESVPGDTVRGLQTSSRKAGDPMLNYLEMLRASADVIEAVRIPTEAPSIP